MSEKEENKNITVLKKLISEDETLNIPDTDKIGLYNVLEGLFGKPEFSTPDEILDNKRDLMGNSRSIRNKYNRYKYFYHLIDEKNDISYSKFYEILKLGLDGKQELRTLIDSGKANRLFSLLDETGYRNVDEVYVMLMSYIELMRSIGDTSRVIHNFTKDWSHLFNRSSDNVRIAELFVEVMRLDGISLDNIEVDLEIIHRIAEVGSGLSLNTSDTDQIKDLAFDYLNKAINGRNKKLDFYNVFFCYRMVWTICSKMDVGNFVSILAKSKELIKEYILKGNLTDFLAYCVYYESQTDTYRLLNWGNDIFGSYDYLMKYLYEPNDKNKVEIRLFLETMKLYDYNSDARIVFSFNHLNYEGWEPKRIKNSDDFKKQIIISFLSDDLRKDFLSKLVVNFEKKWRANPKALDKDKLLLLEVTSEDSLEELCQEIYGVFEDVLKNDLSYKIKTVWLDQYRFIIEDDQKDKVKLVEIISALPQLID